MQRLYDLTRKNSEPTEIIPINLVDHHLPPTDDRRDARAGVCAFDILEILRTNVKSHH
jgi:hypothetical protein